MKKRVLFPLLFLSLTLEGCVFEEPESVFTFVDNKKDDYKVGDKFFEYIDNGGLSVYRNDELFTWINPATSRKRYTVILSDNQTISKGFTAAGSYDVTIKFNGADDLSYSITVKEDDQGGGGEDTPPVIDDDDPPEVTHVESVSLNKTSLSMTKGDTFQLNCTVLPNDANDKNVTWSTSNSSVASVSQNGLVTANAVGNATITVKTIDGNKTATCNVSVQELTVAVTGVSVSPTNKTLNIGEEVQLSATISPNNATNKDVTWSSSNSNIASVSSSGKVTAMAVGNATITVKTVSGNKTATCAITVKNVDNFDKIEINTTNSPKAYSTSETLKISEKNFTFNNVGTSYTSGYMQFRKSSGFISNNDLITSLNSIVFETDKDFIGCIYSGTSKSSLTNETNFDGSGTYKIPEGDTFFKIAVGSKTGYVQKIIINYQNITINPTGISIPSTLNIAAGSSGTLSVTYTPSNCNKNKGINWLTSDSQVATVSNGVVTGVKPGTATITAKSTYNSSLVSTCTVTVTNVSVTGVSLDTQTANLAINGTKQLNATISPSNATNKSVTWSSNNELVATVSSTGLVTAKAVGTTTITVKTIDGNKTANCTISVSNLPQYPNKWTILIYMCGADLESDPEQGGCATEDLDEILSVNNQPNDVQIVIEAGGAKSWQKHTDVISTGKLNRMHVRNKKLVSDSQITRASMGKSSTLQSFIEWGLETYPAENIGLIFWNHGGALDGVCFDELNNNDSLTNDEIYSAIKNAKANKNYTKNFEFIGYDACLMAIQDAASMHAEYANYMVSSQESEWGYGWSYNLWVPTLYSYSTTETITKKIVDSFYADTQEAYTYWGEPNDQTLSVLNLSNWNAYKTSFDSFSAEIKNMFVNKSTNWSTFSTAVNKAQKYGYCYYDEEDNWMLSYNNSYLYDVFDVGGVISSLKTAYKNNSTLLSKLNDWSTVYDSLVLYEKHGSGAGNSTGLCLFCPISGYNEKTIYQDSVTNLTTWASFTRSYGNWYR